MDDLADGYLLRPLGEIMVPSAEISGFMADPYVLIEIS